MKKKIFNILLDIIFIMIVFSVTDWLMANVFRSDKLTLELAVYIGDYALFAGIRWLVKYIIKKLKKK